MIYLDSASTERLHPKAREAMLEAFDYWANPSGLSQPSKAMKNILERSRRRLKEIFNVKNNAELIFTSSASESNNIIFNSESLPILISKFEHPSVYNHPKVYKMIDLDPITLEEELKKGRFLISVSLVNNESGMILIDKGTISLIKRYGSKVHVDASQAKTIDFDALGCDYMTVSSHKMGGPVGVAAVISKTILPVIIHGGGQEFDIRSGTEPVPLVAGFAAAAEELCSRRSNDIKLNMILRKFVDSRYFFSNFSGHKHSCHIICLLTYERLGTEVYAYMDMRDIVIAYGSACSSGALNGPMILDKFDLPSKNGVRISFGWDTTEADVEKFGTYWQDLFG